MTDLAGSDSTQTLLLLAIFVLASLLHGISGLGVTLVTTTALASMYPLPHAIVLVIFPSLLLNVMTWVAVAQFGKTSLITADAIGYWL